MLANWNKYHIALLLGSLVSIPLLFYRLDAHPVFLWDEARQATNLMEMLDRGNPFITYFEGSPDHYNTKPPLLIWLQAICMLLTNNLELSLRLPSALAGLGVCLGLIWFFNQAIGKPFWGLLATLILVSTSGFIELHGTRTGDYDALVSLWIFLATAHFYFFLKGKKPGQLYLFFLFLGLGIATKGPVPLMILPSLIVWSIFGRNLKTLLKNRAFWKGAFIPLLFVGVFYGIRGFLDPGYFESTWYNDFAGRYGETIDGHQEPFLYYFFNFVNNRIGNFVYLLPLGLLLFLISNRNQKDIGLFSLLFVTLFLLIISLAGTKIFWYDTPVFPFFAIMLAVTLLFSYEWIKKNIKTYLGYSLLLILLLWIFIYPYHNNWIKVVKNEDFEWEGKEFYEPSRLLKTAINGEVDLKGAKLLYDSDYKPHYEVYMRILEKEQGYRLKYLKELHEAKDGDVLLYFQPHSYADSIKILGFELKEVEGFDFMKELRVTRP